MGLETFSLTRGSCGQQFYTCTSFLLKSFYVLVFVVLAGFVIVWLGPLFCFVQYHFGLLVKPNRIFLLQKKFVGLFCFVFLLGLLCYFACRVLGLCV